MVRMLEAYSTTSFQIQLDCVLCLRVWRYVWLHCRPSLSRGCQGYEERTVSWKQRS